MLNWTRRQIILKGLVGALLATAAKLSGWFPELEFFRQGQPTSVPLPWYLTERVEGSQITGEAKAQLLRDALGSADFREVTKAGSIKPPSVQSTDIVLPHVHATSNLLVDGASMAILAVPVSQDSLVIYFQERWPGPGRTAAQLFKVETDMTKGRGSAVLSALTHGGSLIQRMEPNQLPPDAALAAAPNLGPDAPCHPCNVCVKFNVSGFNECCGICAASCAAPVADGVLCLGCAVANCAGKCYVQNCGQWQQMCCGDTAPGFSA